MKQDAWDRFVAFTEQYEGKIPWMYCDSLGLVTTAIGNLVDPFMSALGLPWQVGEAPATPAEVEADWRLVKANPAVYRIHGAGGYAGITKCRLTDEGIGSLVMSKARANDHALSVRFRAWETWPADAQLATMSCAWAAGAAWVAPHFDAAANALDWRTCATECWLRDSTDQDAGKRYANRLPFDRSEYITNPGLRARNMANVALFLGSR